MMKRILFLCIIVLFFSCQKHSSNKIEQELEIKTEENNMKGSKPSILSIKNNLQKKGYQIFDFVNQETGHTTLMQQYYIAFLKRGPNKPKSKEEAERLQKLHLGHLEKMYKEGYADISGPFGDDGNIRGITIYNTPNKETADSLANLDPMVKAGHFIIEIHPWWAEKGVGLR